jgi:L-threonylcarbamoyladenylate synthase
MTTILKVNPNSPESELIDQAAQVIRSGGLVAFPTETVYGLGANALDEGAVKRIFEVKGRPEIDPLIVHLADIDQLERVTTHITDLAFKLAEVFWPGPLTLIQWKRIEVPLIVTSGLPTLAARIPAHPVALALLRASGVPIAAPSANLFGRSSPTTAKHVLKDLGGSIEIVLDGGATFIGVESTVLDITTHPPVILRPGGVSREAIEEVIGQVAVRNESTLADKPQLSPGMLSKHYAPHADLVLCTGTNPDEALIKMKRLVENFLFEDKRVGLLVADEDIHLFKGLDATIFSLGKSNELELIAHRLYYGLRELDDQGVDLILTRDFGNLGLGLAISDRLKRAASQVV